MLNRRKIAAIVLNYNNWRDTIACLDSLLAGQPAPGMVVVVDNASNGNDIEQIRQWGAMSLTAPTGLAHQPDIPLAGKIEFIGSFDDTGVFLIQAGANCGYAAGNNLGIKLALACDMDAVWILNNDTVVAPDAFAAMEKRLFAKKRPGLCGSLVVYHDTSRVQCRGGGYCNKWTGLSLLNGNMLSIAEAQKQDALVIEKQLNFIYGASVMVSREFLLTVGLMDERFFLYCEEQDWAWRGEKCFDLAYAPQAIVYHMEGATTGWSARTFRFRSLFTLLRSRLILTVKHTPYALPTVMLASLYAFLRVLWRKATGMKKAW